MRAKPGQHLSQAGVDLARWVGRRTGPFDRVMTSRIPRAFETALAMGFAVDEQLEDLAAMPDDAEDEVGSWDAGFAAWARAVKKGGPAARYGQTLAGLYRRIAESLPEGGAALIVSHGGIVELGAVACLPDADHAAWGPYCRCCEGVRLEYAGGEFTGAKVLRVPLAPEG
jgi:broad specificity phosphatase PhoE